ncbi:MAG: mitochondrial inner membrane protein required for protein import [Stictis urceolatum]|nr:mitochondrial inner membrane protein required for protein import [Stictis urceolata]
MLLRAAPRALKAGSLVRPAYPSISSLQLRSYAKNNKPRKSEHLRPPPHNADLTRGSPIAQPHPKNSAPEKSTVGSSDKSGRPDFSTAQDEFQTSADGEKNTTPQDTSPSAIDPAEAKAKKEESQIPFHDLTKGIPSTLDAELEASSKKGQAEGEEQQGPQASSGGRGERRMPASAYETSADRRRNKLMSWMLAAMGLGVATGVVYFGRDWDNEEEARAHPEASSGWGFGKFYDRIMARMGTTLDYYNEPAFPKLLPDPDPVWERPYTLVLSLEDLLVHSEWSREHGWRMAKRPGVDYFLRYLSQYYELVIFTSLPSMAGGPVVQKLDPFRIVLWPLFREATRYKNGEYVKVCNAERILLICSNEAQDLSYLNRDRSKIIMVDTDKSHAQLQPENAIILPKWKGTTGDKGLVSLIPFLEYVAAMGLDDTRKVLASFEGKDIPTEFAKREQQARERFTSQLAEERSKRPRKSGVGFLGSALGIKSGAGMETADGMPTLTEGFEQGKMLHDQIRERGQKQYEIMEKEIRENGEKWLKEAAEEEKRMQEEAMKGMTAGFKGWFGNAPSTKGDGK